MHTPQIEQGLRLWQRLCSRCLPGRRGRQRLRWRLPVPPALKVPAGQGVQAKSTVVLQAPGIKQYPASQAKQHSWQLVLAACGRVECVANITDYHAVTVIEKGSLDETVGQEEQEESWVEVQGWRISKPGQTSTVHVVQTLLPPFEANLEFA